MKQVYILVGPSGCGKSTWVHEFKAAGREVLVCSADDFHMVDVFQPDGSSSRVYKFDPAKAGMAHSSCLNLYLKGLRSPTIENIVVDNTNVSQWERQNYVAAAMLVNALIVYVVWTVRTVEEIKLCAGRNSHGVSPGIVSDMAVRQDFDEASALLYPNAKVRRMVIGR